MLKKLSLKQNFTWMFFANLIYAFFQWLVLIILAKFGTQELVGLYTLGLSITAPVMIFSNLQLRAIQATDAKNKNSFSDFFTLRFIFMVMGIFVVAFIMVFSNYNFQVSVIIIVIAIGKSIEGMSDIIYGYFQKEEDMSKIGISLILRSLFYFLAFFFAFFFTNSLLIAVLCSSAAWLLVLILYDIKMVKALEEDSLFKLNLKNLFNLFKLSLPLGIVTMVGSLNTNIPRYFIENLLSLEILGIFGAISYILVGTNKFTTAISQTISPRLAKYYAEKDIKSFMYLFVKILSVNILLGFTGLIMVFLFGKEILTILYTEEYAEYEDLFKWVMFLSIFNYIGNLLGVATTSMRMFLGQLPIHLIKLIVILTASYFFIDIYGINGAVMALITSSIVSILFYIKLFLKGMNKAR